MAVALCGLFFVPGTSSAQPAAGTGALTVVDAPQDSVSTMDANCGGIFDPCGIVNNRTSRSLQVARDSTSKLSCSVPAESPQHPRGWVAPGRNSNQSPPGFKDTDCFRSTECSVFYLGIWHPPYDWVRIHNSVFVYSLSC